MLHVTRWHHTRAPQALLLVESACQHRPTSASHRLAATALASLLGCPGTAAHHYAALEVGSMHNVQFDM